MSIVRNMLFAASVLIIFSSSLPSNAYALNANSAPAKNQTASSPAAKASSRRKIKRIVTPVPKRQDFEARAVNKYRHTAKTKTAIPNVMPRFRPNARSSRAAMPVYRNQNASLKFK